MDSAAARARSKPFRSDDACNAKRKFALFNDMRTSNTTNQKLRIMYGARSDGRQEEAVVFADFTPVASSSLLDNLDAQVDIAGRLDIYWNLRMYHIHRSLGDFVHCDVKNKMVDVLESDDLVVVNSASPLDASEHDENASSSDLEWANILEHHAPASGSRTRDLWHDLEAAYWILCWAVHCAPEGPLPRIFQEWLQSDLRTCYVNKCAWQCSYYEDTEQLQRPGWAAIWHVLDGMRETNVLASSARCGNGTLLSLESNKKAWMLHSESVVKHARGWKGDASVEDVVDAFEARWGVVVGKEKA